MDRIVQMCCLQQYNTIIYMTVKKKSLKNRSDTKNDRITKLKEELKMTDNKNMKLKGYGGWTGYKADSEWLINTKNIYWYISWFSTSRLIMGEQIFISCLFGWATGEQASVLGWAVLSVSPFLLSSCRVESDCQYLFSPLTPCKILRFRYELLL